VAVAEGVAVGVAVVCRTAGQHQKKRADVLQLHAGQCAGEACVVCSDVHDSKAGHRRVRGSKLEEGRLLFVTGAQGGRSGVLRQSDMNRDHASTTVGPSRTHSALTFHVLCSCVIT
jgi:hypothetical protein